MFAGCAINSDYFSWAVTTVEPEPTPEPDFYNRAGVACWRFTDMIWCEDGYESTEDETHEQAPEQGQQ